MARSEQLRYFEIKEIVDAIADASPGLIEWESYDEKVLFAERLYLRGIRRMDETTAQSTETTTGHARDTEHPESAGHESPAAAPETPEPFFSSAGEGDQWLHGHPARRASDGAQVGSRAQPE